MKTLLIAALILLAVPAYSQTFCNRIGNSIVCQGDDGVHTVQPLGRNGGVITDDRGNVSPYNNNGTIIESESRSYRDAQRRSEERRREMIYGDDRRRDDSRSRSRWDEEYGR